MRYDPATLRETPHIFQGTLAMPVGREARGPWAVGLVGLWAVGPVGP